MRQPLYISYPRTQSRTAAVNTCQQAEDNILRRTTTRGNSLSKLISSERIYTLGESEQDNKDTLAKDSADKEYAFMTSLLGAITICPNGQNDI